MEDDVTNPGTSLLDTVAAQMYDDASDPEDPHWDDLREEQRRRWQRRAQAVLTKAAEHFERQADQAPNGTARTLCLFVADRVRLA